MTIPVLSEYYLNVAEIVRWLKYGHPLYIGPALMVLINGINGNGSCCVGHVLHSCTTFKKKKMQHLQQDATTFAQTWLKIQEKKSENLNQMNSVDFRKWIYILSKPPAHFSLPFLCQNTHKFLAPALRWTIFSVETWLTLLLKHPHTGEEDVYSLPALGASLQSP